MKTTMIPFLMLLNSRPLVFAGPKPKTAGAGDPPEDNRNVPHELDTIEELQARMVEIHDRGNAIRATADQEHRAFTEEETSELDKLDKEFEGIDAEVQRRQKLQAQRERLVKPAPRVTQPADPEPRAHITGGDPVGVNRGMWGWRSFGEFAKATQRASVSGDVDKRLVAAATTYGSEGVQADGGFAVPPDFRETIVKKIQSEDSLLARTDQQFTSSTKLTVPQDNTTPWQTSGGLQVYRDAEAAAMTQSKPKLEQLEVKAHRMTALVPMTDELLEDAPSLSRYLPGKVAEKFNSKINEEIVAGDGAGKMQGLLSSGSLITVSKESGQAADTIKFQNIVKMFARLYAPLRAGAVWLINQDIEPQLLDMTAPGSNHPAYLPPGGLSQAPYGTLMGRPVVAVEACKTLGDKGDIILTNLQTFLTVQKVGGLRQDVSMHLYFDQGMTAFRFVMRIGGQSWWAAAAARLNGSNTLSNVVTLEARA